MKWVGIAVGGLVALVGLAFVLGLLRPREHEARTMARFASSPEEVWAAVTDFGRWPEWYPEARRMERLPDREGRETWLAVGSWGEMTTEVTLREPPRRLETFADAGSFRGRWSYEFAAEDGGTRLTLTERGEVDNPLFRTLMMLGDEHETMTTFLRSLGGRLGEETEPEAVR